MEKVNTHIVLKREDVSNYLSKSEQAALDEMIDRIIRGREKDNKKSINSYYIVNVDEPYAEAVYDIITDGEKSKALGMKTIKANQCGQVEMLIQYIFDNMHWCPFKDEASIDYEKECAGFREPGCKDCILRNIEQLKKYKVI